MQNKDLFDIMILSLIIAIGMALYVAVGIHIAWFALQ